MSISCLEWDDWGESADQWSMERQPYWERVEWAILSLDGKAHTIVKLSANDHTYMVVAGGSSGEYMVHATKDNALFSHLIDDSQSDGSVILDIGGQPGEYPRKRCTSLTVACQAAREYFDTGQLDSHFTWETE
jgi:hypothetical protein